VSRRAAMTVRQPGHGAPRSRHGKPPAWAPATPCRGTRSAHSMPDATRHQGACLRLAPKCSRCLEAGIMSPSHMPEPHHKAERIIGAYESEGQGWAARLGIAKN
jgi:hypothetical protein